jgi:tetratricopeptide (TPR) repeat protein
VKSDNNERDFIRPRFRSDHQGCHVATGAESARVYLFSACQFDIRRTRFQSQQRRLCRYSLHRRPAPRRHLPGVAGDYDLSLAAFAKQNFQEANEKALSAAAEEEAKLAKLRKQEQEWINKAIDAYGLAGDAAYNELAFDKAANAYDKALTHADKDRNPAQWANLQMLLGNTQAQLVSRSEGNEVAIHAKASLEAYHSALQVFTRDGFPRNWAMTQSNLGNALTIISERSEGRQATRYLEDAAAAFYEALEVYGRQHLMKDWASTQRNLGIALMDLGERAEPAEARKYLQQALNAYGIALRMRKPEEFPQDWAMIQNNWALPRELWQNGAQNRGSPFI